MDYEHEEGSTIFGKVADEEDEESMEVSKSDDESASSGSDNTSERSSKHSKKINRFRRGKASHGTGTGKGKKTRAKAKAASGTSVPVPTKKCSLNLGPAQTPDPVSDENAQRISSFCQELVDALALLPQEATLGDKKELSQDHKTTLKNSLCLPEGVTTDDFIAGLDQVDQGSFEMIDKLPGKEHSKGWFALQASPGSPKGMYCARKDLPANALALKNLIALFFPVNVWGWLTKDAEHNEQLAYTLEMLEAAMLPMLQAISSILGVPVYVCIIDQVPIVADANLVVKDGVPKEWERIARKSIPAVLALCRKHDVKYMLLSKEMFKYLAEIYPDYKVQLAAAKDIRLAFSCGGQPEPANVYELDFDSKDLVTLPESILVGYHPCAKFFAIILGFWRAAIWAQVLKPLATVEGGTLLKLPHFAEFRDFSNQAAVSQAVSDKFNSIGPALLQGLVLAYKANKEEVKELVQKGLGAASPLAVNAVLMKLSHEGNAFLVIQRMVIAAKDLTLKDLNKPGTSALAKAGLLFLQKIGKKRAAQADAKMAEEDWDFDGEVDKFVKIYAMVTAARGLTLQDLNKPGTSALAKAGLLFLQKIGRLGGKKNATIRRKIVESSVDAVYTA